MSRRRRRYYKIQPKSQYYLLKIQYFCNFSLVSLSIHRRSHRGAQRIRARGVGAGPRRHLRVSFVQALQTSSKTNKRSSLADVKQNKPKKRIRAIYYWYYNTRSCPADVKQNKRSRIYHRKIQNFSNYLPFGNSCQFWKLFRSCRRYYNIQPKSKDYLKIQYFCNFSLVSLSIHPRLR